VEATTRVVILNTQLVLLGDSIIDNKTYVLDGELSVLEHIQSKTETPISQLALDGATTDDVISNQINVIPFGTSHIVLSVGGNDLLNEIGFLMEDFKYTPNQVLKRCHSLIVPITQKYESIVSQLQTTSRANLLLCTVYEGNLEDSAIYDDIAISSRAMLSLFNDSIYKTHKKFRTGVLELRNIFTENEDYANPIEPSHQGGEKLATKLVEWVDATS
jgi:hypothetical protein